MKKIFTSKVFLYSMLLVVISFVSVGYSAFSTDLNISGKAAIRTPAIIRISGINVGEMVDGASALYDPAYSKNTTTVYSSFSGYGVAHYDSFIKNTSDIDYIVSKITIDSSNDNHCFLNNLIEGDVIEKGSEKEFEIAVSSKIYDANANANGDDNNTCVVEYEFDVYIPPVDPDEAVLLSDRILIDNGGDTAIAAKGSPDFGSAPTSENSGMYAASENSGTTYYFRGNVDNNYVLYDNKYWRIIRITDDKSIRMIYQGPAADSTGSAATTGSSGVYVTASGSKSSSAASPYKTVYGPSAAKTAIDNFYSSNLISGEEKYSVAAEYCNDVTNTSGSAQVSASSFLGDVDTSVTYAGSSRYSNKSPSFTCPTNAYKYSIGGGNQVLNNPVAMITMDEVMYAGGGNFANSDYYLNIGVAYWTMTPYQYSYVLISKSANVFLVKADGTLSTSSVTGSAYYRPVVTLNSDVVWGGGNGMSNHPYLIGDGNSVDIVVDPTPYINNTLASTIESIYNDGDSSIFYHTSDLENSASDNSYRYSGANPNNYVCFGSAAATCPSDNLYRIIGIIDGKAKLISADYATTSMLGTDNGYIGTVALESTYIGHLSSNIPTYAYNNGSSEGAKNAWGTSPLALYNLNANLLNTFSSEWQNKIVTSTWRVGNVDYFAGLRKTASSIYKDEIQNTDTTSFSGKIGIIYVHEYGFGTKPLSWTKKMEAYNSTYVKNNNWLYLGMTEWVISHGTYLSIIDTFAAGLAANGGITYGNVASGLPVRATFSINANTIYTGGTGTRDDPMRIN